jgi:large subunit ribosomal protein L25
MEQTTETISAKGRDAGSKGAARKLRAQGLVPAVAYGPSSAPRYLALDPKNFVLLRRKFGLSHIYDVAVEGGTGFKALIKAVQSDPLTRALLHVDLYEIDMGKPIRVDVKVELTGKPAGLIDGGMLSHILRSVGVSCLPGAIPEKILADVSHLKIGDSLHLSDLTLPEGVKLTNHGNEAVALVTEPEAAPAAAEPAAAAGAAAPAAAAAAPAKK